MKKLLIILTCILMSVSLFGCGESAGKSQKDDVSDVVLVKNNDELYALFTTKGKQLTDFHFRNPRTDEIYNGVFVACDINAESQYTSYLYNEKGELLISSDSSVTYKLPNVYVLLKDSKYIAIDAKLNEIADVTNMDVNTYIGNKRLMTVGNGAEIFAISNSGEKSPSIAGSKAKVYENDVMTTVVGETQTLVFFGENADYVETLDGHWIIPYYSGDDRYPQYGILANEDTNDFRYYENGKFSKGYSGSDWESVRLAVYSNGIRLVGYKNVSNKEAYLDCDLNKPVKYISSSNKASKHDYNTYAEIDKDGKCTFVVEGNEKNTVSDCKSIVDGLEGHYIVGKTDNLYYLYNEDGSIVNEKGYAKLERVQRNGIGLYIFKENSDGTYSAADSKMKGIAEGFDDAKVEDCGSSFMIVLKYSDKTVCINSSLQICATISSTSLLVYSNFLYDKENKIYYNLEGSVIYSVN